MIRRTILLFGLVLVFVCLPGMAAAQEPAERGDYYITGTTQEGDSYTGGLEILAAAGQDFYTMSWQLNEPSFGPGILQGSVLSASFGDNCLLTSYEVNDGGNSLDGWWASVSDGRLYPEAGKLQSEVGDVVSFAITGSAPDGSTYSGTMDVTLDFEGASAGVVQVVGSDTLTGVGVAQGRVLSVVFGPPGCGVMSYFLENDGSLAGKWAIVGQAGAGSEFGYPIDISGAYNISGTTPDGSEYSGSAYVTADNQVHTFEYDFDGAFPAVGLLRGNTVAVGYDSSSSNETCSVASYFVETDGTLDGLWTVVGSNQTGSEVATRTDTPIYLEGEMIPEIDGSYSVIGTNPGDFSGDIYEGTLDITKQGYSYLLSWTVGDSISYGVGILTDNTLMVGYGGDTCAVNAYFVLGDELSGLWAAYGDTDLGTEYATR